MIKRKSKIFSALVFLCFLLGIQVLPVAVDRLFFRSFACAEPTDIEKEKMKMFLQSIALAEYHKGTHTISSIRHAFIRIPDSENIDGNISGFLYGDFSVIIQSLQRRICNNDYTSWSVTFEDNSQSTAEKAFLREFFGREVNGFSAKLDGIGLELF